MSDPTLDPALRPWVAVDPGSDFPVQNLPFGVFSRRGERRRVGVAIGNHIVDMAALAASGVFDAASLQKGVFDAPTLNPYLAAGRDVWTATRAALSRLLTSPRPPDRPAPEDFLVGMDGARMHLPVTVGDYVDFYSSLDHAVNLGKLFRPGEEPLPTSWRHMPIGYHGRSSTIVPSGTPIRRPSGQRKSSVGSPEFGPTERLDFELEVGFVTGDGKRDGKPIAASEAERHIFGLVLVNDWSARDIQAWEYRPLGPFQGKSFATTISPWVVPLASLAPHRVEASPREPEPLPYLRTDPDLGVDLDLSIRLNGVVISETNLRHTYWTMAQQVAHITANGTQIAAGDLYASGTVSGPTPDSFGSLIELTWNGTRPTALGTVERPRLLEDGDEVTFRGRAGGDETPRVGFGDCTGVITPADD